MVTVKIPYSEWVGYVRVSAQIGRNCDEFEMLKKTSPDIGNNEYQDYVKRELAKLETKLIKDSIISFQKMVNNSFAEMDVYIFEKGLKALKKNVLECLFFDEFDDYSKEVKNELKKGIQMNYMLFIDEFSNYLKREYGYDYSSYMDEIEYVYKKAGIKRFVQEHTMYE